MKALLDTAMNKIASRKLWVWATATGALLAGSLTSADWVTISVVYVGTQGAVDLAERLLRARGGLR